MCITLSVIVDCNEGTELTHFLTWLTFLRGVINTIYEKAFKLGANYLFKQGLGLLLFCFFVVFLFFVFFCLFVKTLAYLQGFNGK